MRGGGAASLPPFLLRTSPYMHLCRLAGYDDKLRRTIGTADPGAVPGGSTITRPAWPGNPVVAGVMTGPN